MREYPECPRCHDALSGTSTPSGGRSRNRPFPDRSTGYCSTCHIGLTKIDGLWGPTPVAPLP